MPVVEQKVPAIDKLDVGVVVVRPSARPCLRDFEVVAAIGKSRTPFHYVYVPDRKMMFAPEMLPEMFFRNPVVFSSFLVLATLIMPSLVPLFFSLVFPLVTMFVLGPQRS
jgi:hypothetical protein